MKNPQRILKKFALVAAVFVACTATLAASEKAGNGNTPKLFSRSTTIEKERPELDEKTKELIAACRKNPSKENLAALKKQIEINYDKVLARKKAKLEELKRTAKHQSKIDEMQEIVDEMIASRDDRVEQSMRRFTDPRLRPDSRKPGNDGFLPVIGAGQNVEIAFTPVTNADYAEFVSATNRKPPKHWHDGKIPAGTERHPVVNVSPTDAAAYCKWLSQKNGNAVFRLPTEEEWEFAAGHMPKDADFNCGEHDGTTPVDAYAKTLSACGAIDMWGNCREITTTNRGKNAALKGGSWKTPRTDCRTEREGDKLAANAVADDAGFRVVKETSGTPKEKSSGKPNKKRRNF